MYGWDLSFRLLINALQHPLGIDIDRHNVNSLGIYPPMSKLGLCIVLNDISASVKFCSYTTRRKTYFDYKIAWLDYIYLAEK